MFPKLYNSSGELLAVLDNIIQDTAQISRVVNGKYILTIEAFEKDLKSEYFQAGNVIKIDDQMFDISYIEQIHNIDIVYKMECEHVHYRLEDGEDNLYEVYTYTGSPASMLADVLAGTDFSAGTVEFTDNITITVNEEITKKELVTEIANTLGGEISFSDDGFTINILNSIGQNNHFQIRLGKNLKAVTKIIENRGELKTYYDVDMVSMKNSTEYISKGYQDLEQISLGDTVRVIDEMMNIDIENQVLSIEYNPIFETNVRIELVNVIELITHKIDEIETKTVTKEKIYNGCRIGPDEGYVAERSDEKAKTVMNATEGISIYSDLGVGYVRNFYVDTEGRIQAKSIEIDDESLFYGTVNILNEGTEIKMAPDLDTAFSITHDATELFKVTNDGVSTIRQADFRNDLLGSSYVSIDNAGISAYDGITGIKTFEIDSSGKAYFRGDITSEAIITGSTIRTGEVGTNRIELSNGEFAGVTSDEKISGLYFQMTPTGIVDLYLYHRDAPLVEFYDDYNNFAIRGTLDSTGMSLGGTYAPTYPEGDWNFVSCNIYNLVTNSGGSHNHGASSGSAGGHTHSVTVDGTAYTTTSGGSHSHSVSVNSGGSHAHQIT